MNTDERRSGSVSSDETSTVMKSKDKRSSAMSRNDRCSVMKDKSISVSKDESSRVRKENKELLAQSAALLCMQRISIKNINEGGITIIKKQINI